MTPGIDAKSASSLEQKCLLCFETFPNLPDIQKKSRLTNFLQTKIKSDSDLALRGHLSSFFLVKNILGLSKDFLATLLQRCGNPSDWQLKLCRVCKRRFEEAELLWDRMCQLQRDYEKVTFEIKDTLVSSITDEEVEGLNDSNKDADELNVSTLVKTVRNQFLVELQEQCDDQGQQQIDVLELSSSSFLRKSSCVKYLSYKVIEDKLKDILKGFRSSAIPGLPCQKCSNFSDVTNDTAIGIPNGDGKPRDLENNLVRIVSTDKLMDESEESQDNDSVPIVSGIVKHEFAVEVPMELVEVDVSGESGADPLSPDDKDPDYVPSKDDNEERVPEGKGSRAKIKTKEVYCRLENLEYQAKKKGIRSYECSKCSSFFESRLGCWVHILKDHYGEKKPYHCQICRKKFTMYFPLRQHVSIVHNLNRTAYDEDPVSPLELEASPHSDLGKTSSPRFAFTCPICKENFRLKKNAVAHFKDFHPEQKIPRFKLRDTEEPVEQYGFECTICSGRKIEYRAPTRDVLESHYRKVHNQYMEIRSKIKTKIMTKKGMSAGNPAPAASSPSGPSIIKCPDCGAKFSSISSMAEHLNKPEHKCSECPKHFEFESDLRNHIDQAHYNRSFQCPYCPKMFSTMTVYEKHIENHQTFDSHQCEVCQVKVTGYPMLVRHMARTHPDYNADQAQLPQQVKDGVGNPSIFGL